MSSMSEIDFSTVPIHALNISSRLRLAWFLNPEQQIPSSNGIARDYRGLAELMDFEYNDIKNFQRNENPTMKILEACDGNFDVTISHLIQFLEKMERHDVIQDMLPQVESDGNAYLRRTKQFDALREIDQTSHRVPEFESEEDPNVLTISDAKTGELTRYDAYVCYADENSHFVFQLAQCLESPEIGFKLFIRGRDLLLGKTEINSHAKLIEERCRRMLIILSPDFLESNECEFQASFAAGLAIEQRKRKLIPIVVQPCEIPSILKYVSKIDFTKPGIQSWMWNKLIISIQDNSSPMFVSQEKKSISPKAVFPQLEMNTLPSDTPIITFPQTLSILSQLVTTASTASSTNIFTSVISSSTTTSATMTTSFISTSPISSSSTFTAITPPSTSTSPTAITAITPPSTSTSPTAITALNTSSAVVIPAVPLNETNLISPKTNTKFKWLKNFKELFTNTHSSHGSSSTSPTSLESNATSGYNSQSSNNFESTNANVSGIPDGTAL